MQTIPQYILDGARAYARAESSDPFAYARAMTHIRAGLCRPLQDGQSAHYTADFRTEARSVPLADGKSLDYNVEVPANLKRP